MAAPVILIETQPRRAADGVAETVRLAGGGAALPYYYFGQHWRAGIVGLPTFICSLDFPGDDLGTGAVAQAAEIRWGNSSQSDLDTMAAYFWGDAPITVRIAPEGAEPAVVLTGKVLQATIEDGGLKIALGDPSADLKKPLLTERYGGAGGLDGPAEWAGTIKRRVWGRVWNLRGDPIDKAHNIFCFADPSRPIQAFTAVRDKGAPAAAVTTVAWAGSAAATLVALQAAVAPVGGGVLCPSIACVKWWTQPAGDLCVDLQGEIGAGYVETTAEIAERLVQALGGPEFVVGTVAAAAAARPAPVGWIAKDENETVSAMLDALLGNSSLLWLLDAAGKIVVRQWAWGASVAAAISEDVSRKVVFKPVTTRKLGYRRNEQVMGRGDIAGIVFATDVAFNDGVHLQSLQPAEAGATAGAPSGTPVGSITADDVSGTINSGGGVAPNKVTTIAITPTAVTANGLVITNPSIDLLPAGNWVDLQSYSFTATGGALLVWGRFDTQWQMSSGESVYYIAYRLLRNDVPVAGFGPSFAGWARPSLLGSDGSGMPINFSWIDYPGAGAFTFKMQAYVTTGGTGTFSQITALVRELMVIEVKR